MSPPVCAAVEAADVTPAMVSVLVAVPKAIWLAAVVVAPKPIAMELTNPADAPRPKALAPAAVAELPSPNAVVSSSLALEFSPIDDDRAPVARAFIP